MPDRIKHRNWHAPLLIAFGVVLLILVAGSIYVGSRPAEKPEVSTDLPFDISK